MKKRVTASMVAKAEKDERVRRIMDFLSGRPGTELDEYSPAERGDTAEEDEYELIEEVEDPIQPPRKQYPQKTYYTITEDMPLEEILNKWYQEGKQGYDKHIHAHFSYPEIAPYKEFNRTLENGNLYPEEWAQLKESLRQGFNENDPILLYVGRNETTYVGEGNHRLAIINELYQEDPETYAELYNNIPVRFWFTTTATPTKLDTQTDKELEG